MPKITCPAPFNWTHGPAGTAPTSETFPDFVDTLVKRTQEFGKWPNVLHAIDILKATKGKTSGQEIELDADALRALAKAVRTHTWLPDFAIGLAEAGFFQAIDNALKPVERGK